MTPRRTHGGAVDRTPATQVQQSDAPARSPEGAPGTQLDAEARLHFVLGMSGTVLFEQDRNLAYTSIQNVHPGFVPEQVLGRTDFDLLPPDDAVRIAEIKRRVLDTGVGTRQDVRTTIAGRQYYYDLIVEPRFDAQGNVSGILCAAVDITERKRAQEELAHSKERFRMLVAESPFSIWTCDRDGTIDFANQAALDLFGVVKPDDVIGRYNILRDSTEAEKPLLAHFERAWAGEVVRFRQDMDMTTAKFQTNRNDAVCVETTAFPLASPSDGCPHLAVVQRDVTETERAARTLQIERASFQGLFQNSPEAIALVDNEGLVQQVNDEFTKLFGYAGDEVLNRAIDALIVPPELRDEAQSLALRSANMERVACETVRHTKDGRRIDVSVLGAPIVTEGRQVGVCAIYRDITERKRAEAALRRSEADYRNLVERATYGIYRSTVTGRFTAVNSALVEMLRYGSADELLEIDMARDLFADPAERERIVQQHQEGKHTVHEQVQWRRKDGALITVLLSGRPLYDEKGELEGFDAIAEDVTERRRLEAQLRQAQKMEAIGQLTGGIAHDFNNMLSVILANTQMLLGNTELDADSAAGLREIEEAGQRGATIVRQLLGFSRHADLAPLPTELKSVASRLCSMIRKLLPESIEVRLKVPDEPMTVVADAAAVEQILMNLATNARDAMPGGGVLSVEMDHSQITESDRSLMPWITPGTYVCVSVSDTGAGMDEEVKARLFEPFFTTKPAGVGTGLGMAMVYGLMKQHDGFVRVYSEPNLGTTVRLYFPAAKGEGEGEVRREARAELSESITGGTETILLVEDEEPVRRVAQRALERLGYSVMTASDGAEGLNLYRAHASSVDLVLSDMIMPKMGGWDLYKALRDGGSDVKFVLTSGYRECDTQERLAMAFELVYLHKPWTLESLAACVREVLDEGEGDSRVS